MSLSKPQSKPQSGLLKIALRQLSADPEFLEAVALSSQSPQPQSSSSSEANRTTESKNLSERPGHVSSNNIFRNIPKRFSQTQEKSKPYFRDIILLKQINRQKVFSAKEKEELGPDNPQMMWFESVKVYKSWSEDELKEEIYELFKSKISKSNRFEILSSKGAYLRSFILQPNATIDGEFLLQNCLGDVYIKPQFDITMSTDKDSKLCELDDLMIDHDSDNSSTDIFLPKKKAKKVHSGSSDIIVKKDDNLYYYEDTNGQEHPLIDCPTKNVAYPQEEVRPCGESVKTILQNCASQVRPSHECPMNLKVKHDNVLEAIFRRMKSNFDMFSYIIVRFESEPGFGKGLLKEMLTLAMAELKESEYLEGNDYVKTFKHCKSALDEGIYEQMGQLCSLSLIHGGPAPAFFSRVVTGLLFDGSRSNFKLEVKDVLNVHVKAELETALAAETLEEARTAFAEASIFRFAGTNEQIHGPNFKERTVEAVDVFLKLLLIKRLRPAFKQFLSGLGTLSVLPTLHRNEEVFKDFFEPYRHPLTAQDVFNMFIVDRSPADSPRSRPESHALMYWQYYLDKLEANEKHSEMEAGETIAVAALEDIVIFATGLRREPPCGWVNKPILEFLHERPPKKDPAENSEDDLHLPLADTCVPKLKLPVLNASYTKFCESMNKAVLWCKSMNRS